MQPLIFDPWLRPTVWGGRRLGESLGKALPGPGAYGESWEVSAHPLHASRVAEGPFAGRSLADLCKTHRDELLGSASPDEFPLLVKYLDCADRLSVQVHPDDDLAPRLCGERHGKTEAWVVLEAEPTATVWAGLLPGVTRRDLESALQAGRVGDCLHFFTPQVGQFLFLPAGTVHATGGGILLAEVQQSSDATLRLWDWGRLGSDGRPRTLHVEQALQAIDWTRGPVAPIGGKSCAGRERLVSCAHFILERFRFDRDLPSPYEGRWSIWLVLEGDAVVRTAEEECICRRGQTVLIPATTTATWSTGRPCTLLAATVG